MLFSQERNRAYPALRFSTHHAALCRNGSYAGYAPDGPSIRVGQLASMRLTKRIGPLTS